MTLDQLQIFIAVAETRKHVTQRGAGPTPSDLPLPQYSGAVGVASNESSAQNLFHRVGRGIVVNRRRQVCYLMKPARDLVNRPPRARETCNGASFTGLGSRASPRGSRASQKR